MNDISRLRWRCRRGVREMDILLQHFLEDVYPSLPEADRRVFEQLLEEADADLLDWITGRLPVPLSDYESLIARLRQLNPTPAK